MKYIHNNGYLEPVPRVEKPSTEHYDPAAYVVAFRAYNTWLAARIPVAPGTTWEDREYEESEIQVMDYWGVDMAYPLPAVEEKGYQVVPCDNCKGKGYIPSGINEGDKCEQCGGLKMMKVFTATDPLDIPRFTARDMISHVTQILSGDYIYTCKCNHDIAEYIKEYFKSLNPTQP